MFSYLAFENAFRGESAQVREEQGKYVPLFEGAAPVLDAGCGRGEFLELLREKGIEAYGVDTDDEMRALCRGKGLAVLEGDIISHLEGAEPGSRGGIFASHVLEHLDPPDLLKFINLSRRALRAGGVLVAETLNPACLFSFSPYFMDPTHRFPVHPNTLRFHLEQAGFGDFQLFFREYFPPELLKLEIPAPSDELAALCAENFRRLQLILDTAFSHFIYALAARKGEPSQ